MKPTGKLFAAVTLLLVSGGWVLADEKFERASICFEQNATDDDAEVVIEANGGDVGLATINVVSPDGRTIINFKASNSKLGIRHFAFESPEPKNDGSVQADFPEGEYTFTGTTVTGVKLHGKAALSHKLPEVATVIQPAADAEDVPIKGLEITWRPGKNPVAYIVAIEQEESGHEVTARLPGNVTRFAVPDGFLAAGTEYKIAIGTVTAGGNSSFVETTFSTAKKE